MPSLRFSLGWGWFPAITQRPAWVQHCNKATCHPTSPGSWTCSEHPPHQTTHPWHLLSIYFSKPQKEPWGRKLRHAQSLSWVWLFAAPWTVACQAPLSIGIRQARILDGVAMPSSRGSFQPRDWTRVFWIAGRFFTTAPPGKPQGKNRSELTRVSLPPESGSIHCVCCPLGQAS